MPPDPIFRPIRYLPPSTLPARSPGVAPRSPRSSRPRSSAEIRFRSNVRADSSTFDRSHRRPAAAPSAAPSNAVIAPACQFPAAVAIAPKHTAAAAPPTTAPPRWRVARHRTTYVHESSPLARQCSCVTSASARPQMRGKLASSASRAPHSRSSPSGSGLSADSSAASSRGLYVMRTDSMGADLPDVFVVDPPGLRSSISHVPTRVTSFAFAAR